MRENDLRELEVERAGTRLRLVRADDRDAPPPAVRATGADRVDAAPTTARAITSPMVGTFHRAPAAGAPAFIESGDLVDRGQVLCIIEAMKMMNEIEAEFRGRVAQILIDNGAPVEYGEALFLVEPL
jgi:acetyl-CoA carboxylase biotin carboxyl carrier protein